MPPAGGQLSAFECEEGQVFTEYYDSSGGVSSSTAVPAHTECAHGFPFEQWGGGPAWDGGPNNHFSIRWSGRVMLDRPRFQVI